jgi:hypothetical protein
VPALPAGYAQGVFPSGRQLGLICLVWAVVAWYTVAVWTLKATDTDWAGAFGTHYAMRAPLVGAAMGLLWSPLFVLGYQPARALLAAARGRDVVEEDTLHRHVGRYFRGAVLGQFVGASISVALLALWPLELMNSRIDALKWAGVFWKLYWYLFVPAAAVAGAGSVAMAARHRIRPAAVDAQRPAWDPEPDLAAADAWGSVDAGADPIDLDRVEQASARVGLALLRAPASEAGGCGFVGASGLRVEVARRPDPEEAGVAWLVVTLFGAPPSLVGRDAALARVLAAVAAGVGGVSVRLGVGTPLNSATVVAALGAALPPHLPAELFVRLTDVAGEGGTAALSEGMERYTLPEVMAHGTTPEAARSAAWSLVRRVLVAGTAVLAAPGISEAEHPGGRVLRYMPPAP